MTTALECIIGAMKLIGVLYKNETPSSDEANDGLIALNDMLNSWSNDDLITFSYALEAFTLTGGISYTIGNGGQFNTSRPINIADSVIRVGNIDYPVEAISQVQYQKYVALKSLTSTIPQFMTYDNGFPLGTIKFYPATLNGTLYLQSNKPLGTYTSLTDIVSLPVGFVKAIKYNLALELAPQYGIEPTQIILRQAQLSLGAIKRATTSNSPMPLLPSNINTQNIYTGYFS